MDYKPAETYLYKILPYQSKAKNPRTFKRELYLRVAYGNELFRWLARSGNIEPLLLYSWIVQYDYSMKVDKKRRAELPEVYEKESHKVEGAIRCIALAYNKTYTTNDATMYDTVTHDCLKFEIREWYNADKKLRRTIPPRARLFC